MFWVNAPLFSKQFIDCALQDSGWRLGFAIKSCAFLRDRMLAEKLELRFVMLFLIHLFFFFLKC